MEQKETKKDRKVLVWAVILLLIAANIFAAFLLITKLREKKAWEAQFAPAEDSSQINSQEEIEFFLPETIYAMTGSTMEIYNAQVTSLGTDITTYNVLWNCEVGENLKRKFSVTEEMPGRYDLTLEIYDNGLNLVTKKQCTLKIVETDSEQEAFAKNVENLSDVPAECAEQVRICVDTEYNGTLENLKTEGVAQMQDVVWAVLSGLDQ